MPCATYLITRGIFNKSLIELLGGAVVVAIWGTVLVGGLVPQDGISWQGHLCGGVAGVVAASVLSKRRTESTSRPAALAAGRSCHQAARRRARNTCRCASTTEESAMLHRRAFHFR